MKARNVRTKNTNMSFLNSSPIKTFEDRFIRNLFNGKTIVDHSITVFMIIFTIILFSALQLTAQEVVKEKKVNETTKSIKSPNSTQATGDKTSIKDESGNVLMEVTDEGTAGSIKLNDAGNISTSTNKLYNNGGSLYWSGSALGSGSGATQINDLSDGKYENLSLFLGEGAGNTNSNKYGNTGIGYQSLYKNTYDQNTALGRNSGYENTTGGQNVLIGPETNRFNQQGNNNTIIGFQAGYGNATLHNKTGSVFIGFQAGYNELGSDKLYIENSNSSTPLIWGDFATDKVKINGDFEVTGNISTNGFPIISDWDFGLGSELILVNTANKVGIGTSAGEASTKLQVKGDEGVLFQGTNGSGTALSLGSGTRFHFYSKKSAIRGGNISGTQWDDTNIGGFSTAFGINTIADGLYSTALCNSTSATNNAAFSIGSFTKASGIASASMGFTTNADAYASLAIGRFNIGGGTADSWVSTDPLFEIGIGTSSSNKDNALTILKNGNVGIGDETPSYKLEIKAASGNDALKVRVGTAGKLTVFSNGGTSIGTDAAAPTNGLLVSGDIRNTGGLLHSSDKRFKTNIKQIKDASEKIMNIRGVYYDWKRDAFPEMNFTDKKQIGVIAQEVEKEFPELVRTGDDGYKSVDYTKLTPILLEAVKEQQKSIEYQDIRIKTLEEENQKLTSIINEMSEMKTVLNKLLKQQPAVKVSSK